MAAAPPVPNHHNPDIPHGEDARGNRLAGHRDIFNKLRRMVGTLPQAIVAPEGAGGGADRNNNNEALNEVLAAIDTYMDTENELANRLRGETVVPISTPLPEFGNVDDLPNERDVRITYYTGGHDDRISCLTWLEKVALACGVHNLTAEASANMLERYAQGEAAEELAACRRQQMNFEEMVRRMEIRFAGMVTPEEARKMCLETRRNRNELLPAFGTRVYNRAWLAFRDRPVDERNDAAVKLAIEVFKAELSESTKQILRNEEIAYMGNGNPPWSFAEYVARATRLESNMRAKEPSRHPARVAYIGLDP